MLVEAAWAISGAPGPLRAFFIRIRDKRGKHVAAVATAPQVGGHRLAHSDQGRGPHLGPPGAPAMEAPKTRAQSRSSVSPRRPPKRIRRRLQQKSVRDSERETIANAEEEYRRFVATWKQQSPKGRSGAKMRCDDHRLRDRAGTSTLLFATWSPEPP